MHGQAGERRRGTEGRRLTLSPPSSEFKSLTLDRSKSISLSTKRRQPTHAPFCLSRYISTISHQARVFPSIFRAAPDLRPRNLGCARLNNRAWRAFNRCSNSPRMAIRDRICFLSGTFLESASSENSRGERFSSPRDDAEGCRIQSFRGETRQLYINPPTIKCRPIQRLRCNIPSHLHVTSRRGKLESILPKI